MDQLLVVSLSEEKLNSSIEDLDRSLIQARNTLQAAYAEVQRLLLLRQQVRLPKKPSSGKSPGLKRHLCCFSMLQMSTA